MIAHTFKVGHVVGAGTTLSANTPPGPYEIRRPLPATGMINQYRVKCLKNGHERVIREDDVLRNDN